MLIGLLMYVHEYFQFWFSWLFISCMGSNQTAFPFLCVCVELKHSFTRLSFPVSFQFLKEWCGKYNTSWRERNTFVSMRFKHRYMIDRVAFLTSYGMGMFETARDLRHVFLRRSFIPPCCNEGLELSKWRRMPKVSLRLHLVTCENIKSVNCESLSRVNQFFRNLWRGDLHLNNVIFQ